MGKGKRASRHVNRNVNITDWVIECETEHEIERMAELEAITKAENRRKLCRFVTVGGTQCKDLGHYSEKWNGQYVEFCQKHYDSINEEVICWFGGKLEEVWCCGNMIGTGTEGVKPAYTLEPQSCMSEGCIDILWDYRDPYDVLCSYCLECYCNKPRKNQNQNDHVSADTLKFYAIKREELMKHTKSSQYCDYGCGCDYCDWYY